MRNQDRASHAGASSGLDLLLTKKTPARGLMVGPVNLRRLVALLAMCAMSAGRNAALSNVQATAEHAPAVSSETTNAGPVRAPTGLTNSDVASRFANPLAPDAASRDGDRKSQSESRSEPREVALLPPADDDDNAPPTTRRLERLKFRAADVLYEVSGTVLVEAEDGGILLLGRDGRLWPIDKPDLVERVSTEFDFDLMKSQELAAVLRKELGPGFEPTSTTHYLILSNTSREYARWCGALFERLQTAFLSFWKQRGVDLEPTSAPMIAIVFKSQREFADFAARDAGATVAGTLGYYSITSNRIVLYDLSATKDGAPATTPEEIEQRLSNAVFNVATVVHEATHQIAFNSGLHTRYADNPQWATEGMAMFFETPDLRNRNGWRTIGAVNHERLARFRDFVGKRRRNDSLRTLVANDERFLDARQNLDAYAESWALTFFLSKARKEQYTTYIKTLRGKSQLFWDTPEQRLADFTAAFGDDFEKLDREFLRYMSRPLR
jgi:hypothetical protein